MTNLEGFADSRRRGGRERAVVNEVLKAAAQTGTNAPQLVAKYV